MTGDQASTDAASLQPAQSDVQRAENRLQATPIEAVEGNRPVALAAPTRLDHSLEGLPGHSNGNELDLDADTALRLNLRKLLHTYVSVDRLAQRSEIPDPDAREQGLAIGDNVEDQVGRAAGTRVERAGDLHVPPQGKTLIFLQTDNLRPGVEDWGWADVVVYPWGQSEPSVDPGLYARFRRVMLVLDDEVAE